MQKVCELAGQMSMIDVWYITGYVRNGTGHSLSKNFVQFFLTFKKPAWRSLHFLSWRSLPCDFYCWKRLL